MSLAIGMDVPEFLLNRGTERREVATSRCGKARMRCTTSCCDPSTGPSRSHGLSGRSSIAMAHSSTARMR